MKPKQDKHNEKHTEVYYKYYIKKKIKSCQKKFITYGEKLIMPLFLYQKPENNAMIFLLC